jgi:hypothetical protein
VSRSGSTTVSTFQRTSKPSSSARFHRSKSWSNGRCWYWYAQNRIVATPNRSGPETRRVVLGGDVPTLCQRATSESAVREPASLADCLRADKACCFGAKAAPLFGSSVRSPITQRPPVLSWVAVGPCTSGREGFCVP